MCCWCPQDGILTQPRAESPFRFVSYRHISFPYFPFLSFRGDAVRPKSHYPQHCQQREVNASVGSHGPITLKNAGGKLLEVFELLEHGQSQEERAPAPSSVALALPRNDPAVTRTRVSSLLKTVIVLNQPFVLPSFPASHLLSVAA